MADYSLQNVGNRAAYNNDESATVIAINSMRELQVSPITSMKATNMTESVGQMRDATDQLVMEEGPSWENDEQLQIAAKTDKLSTEQSDKNEQY